MFPNMNSPYGMNNNQKPKSNNNFGYNANFSTNYGKTAPEDKVVENNVQKQTNKNDYMKAYGYATTSIKDVDLNKPVAERKIRWYIPAILFSFFPIVFLIIKLLSLDTSDILIKVILAISVLCSVVSIPIFINEFIKSGK